MRFKYVGTGADDDPKRIVFRGYQFELCGDAVDVDDDAAVEKLKNIRTFETVKGRPRKASAKSEAPAGGDES